ncbi:unnamed protein product, partial [Adineta steineri]
TVSFMGDVTPLAESIPLLLLCNDDG